MIYRNIQKQVNKFVWKSLNWFLNGGNIGLNPFLQSSVLFHIETGHLVCLGRLNDWLLYEMQHWTEVS